ncbi:hypothetical protein CDD81_6538 [Ophiocordyceps australis]|uniref:DASH complex subunit DAD1 n=1 Tax=Ophiocordyceps australis TaxID=1399860 RepID=A0A2C5YIH0_9HYPO|nr:hypothetical protein CDD81_6538 [Ophiocordyceps australis]
MEETGAKSDFEQQREILVNEISLSFEQVLANINKLNRSLESVIAVGNEFSSVEALWSQFEGVMAKDEAETKAGQQNQAECQGQGQGEGEGQERREDNA